MFFLSLVMKGGACEKICLFTIFPGSMLRPIVL